MNKTIILKELSLAKKVAILAGKKLLKEKDILNKEIFSSNKDIKLHADTQTEILIKDTISQNSE